MFRARLAQLALVAGLGLVTGCSMCYSSSLGAPGGTGGGLFSRFHQNQNRTVAPAGDCGCVAASPSCGCAVTPGCGCAAAPCCEGPVMNGFGGFGGYPGVEPVPAVTTAPHLVPAPTTSPTVPYMPQ